MGWDYKLTKKQTGSLQYLKSNGGQVHQSLADENIHWRVQYNLYVKLLTDNFVDGKGGFMTLTDRGRDINL